MKNRNRIFAIIVGLILVSVASYSQPIIADHTVVDKYSDIPDVYITEVKKMLLNIAGESHARGYRYGLELLEAEDARFAINLDRNDQPELPTSDYLRVSGSVLWPNGNWDPAVGEEDVWTTSWAVDVFLNTIDYIDNTANNPISAVGFGWCYDMIDQGVTGIADPVYGCRWAGRSNYYNGSGGTDISFAGNPGWSQWGIDETDSISLGGARVTMNMYIRAIEEARQSSTKTNVFFTTGPVDYKTTSWPAGREDLYQGHVKHEYIRDHVKSTPDAFLFDYSDILCWSSSGEERTEIWDGHTYQKMRLEYVGDYNGGEGGCHINEDACLRLGKAMWWMLARMSGWNGVAGGDQEDPSQPTNLAGTALSSSSIRLNWDYSTDNLGVTGYRIYRDGSEIATVTDTTYIDTGLSVATEYSYTVSAYDAASNESSNSDVYAIIIPDETAPSQPDNLSGMVLSSSSIVLNWNSSTDNIGVTGYRIFRDGSEIGTVINTSFTDTGLSESTEYFYSVSAYDAASNESITSETVSLTTGQASDVESPTQPANLSGTVLSSSSIVLDWDHSTDNVGVAGYRIYRDGSDISVVVENTFTDAGLSASTEYEYYVRAYDATGNESSSSATETLTTNDFIDEVSPSQPVNLSGIVLSESSITLNWNNSTDNVGVVGYRIYRDGSDIGTVGNNTFTDTGLSVSTEYDYYINAYDAASNTSINSGTVSLTTDAYTDEILPTQPANLSGTVLSSSSITLNWDHSTDNVGVINYVIYRDAWVVGTVTDTTYTDTKLSGATQYKYHVSACDAGGNLSLDSDFITLTTLTTGLLYQSYDQQKYKVAPNPSNGRILISSDHDIPVRIRVINTLGTTIYDDQFFNLPATIDLSDSGLYFVLIVDEESTYIEKVVIK